MLAPGRPSTVRALAGAAQLDRTAPRRVGAEETSTRGARPKVWRLRHFCSQKAVRRGIGTLAPRESGDRPAAMAPTLGSCATVRAAPKPIDPELRTLEV